MEKKLKTDRRSRLWMRKGHDRQYSSSTITSPDPHDGLAYRDKHSRWSRLGLSDKPDARSVYRPLKTRISPHSGARRKLSEPGLCEYYASKLGQLVHPNSCLDHTARMSCFVYSNDYAGRPGARLSGIFHDNTRASRNWLSET